MPLFKLPENQNRPRKLLIQPSASSPFCTNPSQLQEVTLDSDVTTNFSYMGMRSPGAPNNGRSVKEIDEQLTNLKKENFNLKLRIYFLEERMGASCNMEKGDALKKNIELQIELQNVRKELEEKEELLCQAAKAMEIEEEERKKEISFRDAEIYNLKHLLGEANMKLENDLQSQEERHQIALCAEAFDLDIDVDHSRDIRKLQNKIKQLEEELAKERHRSQHLENTKDLVRMKYKTIESESEDNNQKLRNLTTELEELSNKVLHYRSQTSCLQEKLNEKTDELQILSSELKANKHDLKENQTKLKELSKRLDVSTSQKDRQEKRAEKYKSLVSELEAKIDGMSLYITTLQGKVQPPEVRSELKKPNDRAKSLPNVEKNNSNTDALFLERNANSLNENGQFSKASPKINKAQKSLRFDSPASSPAKITKSKSSNDATGNNQIEMKSTSLSDLSSEIQHTREEYAEMRKNHVKACKIIKTMIDKEKERTAEITKLSTALDKKEKEVQCLQDKISELNGCKSFDLASTKKKSIQEKVCEMNLTASTNPADNLENSMAGDEKHLAEQYKELASELETKIEILTATLEQKDSQLEKLKTELQDKSNRIIDLEFELLTLNEGVSNLDSSNEKEDVGNEKLIQEKYEKDKQIERLENELRKRTCDLQGIVNKELWEKNRSIEKLQTVLKAKDQEIYKLEANINGKDLQLKILKDKINELDLHVNFPPNLIAIETTQAHPFENSGSVQDQLKLCLEERKYFVKEIEALQVRLKNTPEHDENRQLTQLRAEHRDLQEELEKSEKLRQEGQEICSVLNTRLEELCYFLDSLLKQKSVLGFLGTDQTRKLQVIVNRSLDLSRNLSASITLNPDQSLLQLSNISNLLDATRGDSFSFSSIFAQDEENNAILSIIPSDITLTYQSHLSAVSNDQEQVIKVLRQQVVNLKREIEIRDVELAKKLSNESSEEQALKNDEEFVDALATIQTKRSIQIIDSPGTIFQTIIEDASKLNVTSSTLVADKSACALLKNPRTTGNQSESESWSEPDRTVSMARIGLLDESLKSSSFSTSSRRAKFGATSDLSTDSTEEEHAHSISRTPSKRTTLVETRQTIIALHEQIYELETKLKDKENQLLAAQVAYYETDNSLKIEQTKLEELKIQLKQQMDDSQKKLEEAERKVQTSNQQLTELATQLKESNKKLQLADEQKKQSEHKITELQRLVTVLEEFKQNVEGNMSTKDKEIQNVINEMEIERTKALKAVFVNEQLLEKAKQDAQAAEDKIKLIQERENKIQDELKHEHQENLKKAEEQYLNSVKSIELNYEAQASKCREAVTQIRLAYEKDYIKKSEVEERVLRVEELTNEMENLKLLLHECDSKIQTMELKETQLTTRLQEIQREHNEKLYELQQELDNASLNYSEEVLEKTKLKNENEELKQRLLKFTKKESELIREVQDLHSEYRQEQSELQVTISNLEQQKTSLESKVTDLEIINAELQSGNAELRNRLVKLQISRNICEPTASTSLPNCHGNIFEIYNNKTTPIAIQNSNSYTRQSSDQSGYTSEEVPLEDGQRNLSGFVQAAIHSIFGSSDTDQERTRANASPDLGIESDHGRFSSLEANVNIPRPLLPALELTQSISNLLDPVQDVSCANDQCSKRTKQIANENVELRKRLLRTRRALEETLNRLTLANRQKKEVEKSICRQIHKTSQVLRKAKANLDSGSENDVFKK